MYVGDNESSLKRFVSHLLNFICHFIWSKVTKKTHSDCFRAFNNTKVGVEEDMLWSFFRINGSRRFEDDDSSNRHGPCGIHSHFLRWGERRKFVFQTFFWNMSSYWSRMSKVILSYLEVFRLGVSKHGHAVLDVRWCNIHSPYRCFLLGSPFLHFTTSFYRLNLKSFYYSVTGWVGNAGRCFTWQSESPFFKETGQQPV